jgi:O-antigen/teichoic acid export membrane protein
VCIVALLVFIKEPKNAVWVNFILGMANAITYLGLLVYFKSKYKLAFRIPLKNELTKITIENFYLTINGVSGNLQQSMIIFALGWGNSGLLGAYTLCDKIIGQCRNLLSTIGSAIYPGAVHIYKQSILQWAAYRRKLKYSISALFFAGGVVIFILADFIVYVLLKQHNADAVIILRIMAFVPVISSFNVFSILDILLKKNNVYLFNISLALFAISTLIAFIATHIGSYFLVGGFMIIIEACAWMMYEFAVKLPSKQNA